MLCASKSSLCLTSSLCLLSYCFHYKQPLCFNSPPTHTHTHTVMYTHPVFVYTHTHTLNRINLYPQNKTEIPFFLIWSHIIGWSHLQCNDFSIVRIHNTSKTSTTKQQKDLFLMFMWYFIKVRLICSCVLLWYYHSIHKCIDFETKNKAQPNYWIYLFQCHILRIYWN